MIVADSICKSYIQGHRKVAVLDQLSVRIAAGDFVAIMGQSGAGKSTLLQLLGCLDSPTSGDYWLNGRRVSQLPEEKLAGIRNQSIGFIFQTSHFIDYLDLIDNVALPGFYAANHDHDECRRRAKALLHEVGLGHRLDHKPGELSGGERQRAAIARALFSSPQLILADEPTGNLDEENTQHLVELLTDLNRSGITIILVTHDADVARVAQRRYMLTGGRLAEIAE